MKKKITRSINQMIIQKKDLLGLSNFIFSEFKKSKLDLKKYTIDINCENDESFEFNGENLSGNETVLNLKRILNLSFSFTDYDDKNIKIYLSQENRSWDKNEYQVEGNEEDWVNSTDQRIKEILDSIKPQNGFFKRLKGLIFYGLSINFGLLLLKAIEFMLSLSKRLGYMSSSHDANSDPFGFLLNKALDEFPFLNVIIYILIAWFLGTISLLAFWYPLEKYFDGLWPSVEFDFGPEHKKYSKNKRRFFALIMTLMIVPIILQIILSFFI